MTKRLLLLNGLAVLMIPFHHASAFGLQALFDWTNRYRPVSVPNYDQIGSVSYYALIFIRQIDAYAIPAFLFVSGFFIAFMSRGKNLTLDSVLPRIKVLMIPLVIWTVIRFALLRQMPSSVFDVFDTYYFLVLLIQFYLLSIFLVPWTRKNWVAVLILTAAIQLVSESPLYFQTIGMSFPGMGFIGLFTPRWLAPSRILYFTLGLVAGIHMNKFKAWLERSKWVLLGVMIGSLVLTFVEYWLLTIVSGQAWVGPNNPGIARIVYATTFSLCFLAFSDLKLPYEKVIEDLGSKSLGIYLVNLPMMYIAAVLMYKFTPMLLGNMLVYMLVLMTVGIGTPLIFMEIVRRTPARVGYRYLFG